MSIHGVCPGLSVSMHMCVAFNPPTKTHTCTRPQVLVVFLALFIFPDPGRVSHCARWSEWSMEAMFNQHGPEPGGVKQEADAAVVEEGKGVGNGERS